MPLIANTDFSATSVIGPVVPATITSVPEFGLDLVFRLTRGTATVDVLADGAVIQTISLPKSTGVATGELSSRTAIMAPASTWGWVITAISGGGIVTCTATAIAADDPVKPQHTRRQLTAATADAVQALVSEAGIGRAKRGASVLRAGKPWLRLPDAAGRVGTGAGITHGGSATGAFTTRNGRRCYEITAPANASLQSMYFAIASGVVTNRQHIVFEVEDAEQWRGGSWRLGFYTDNTFANGVRAVYTPDSYNGYNGVHCLAPLAGEWANVGSGSFASTMTQCIFYFQRKSGATGNTRLWVYEIAEAEKNSVPQIVIGADDGAKTWYTDGLPIVEKYGFSSYMAFIADDRGTASRMSQAEWADAIARGHHAVVHGCKTGRASLADYFSDFTGYASAGDAIGADIAYNRDVMVAEGLDPDGLGRTVYALPQGKHQPTLTTAGDLTISGALDSLGFVGGRLARVQNAVMANGGWSGAADYVPIIGHSWSSGDEAGNIAAVIASMQDEIAAGRSVVLMFHEVRASPSVSEHITAANLEAIVSAAATLVRAGSARAGRLTDLVYELRSYNSPVHIGV